MNSRLNNDNISNLIANQLVAQLQSLDGRVKLFLRVPSVALRFGDTGRTETGAILSRRRFELTVKTPAHDIGAGESAQIRDLFQALGGACELLLRGFDSQHFDITGGSFPNFLGKDPPKVTRTHGDSSGKLGHR